MTQDHKVTRVLVYQMGRVGSTSLNAALNGIGCHSIGIHQLHLDRIEIPVTPYQMMRRTARRMVFPFEPLMAKGRAKVVSLVRDPLKRNISSFFFNLALLAPGYETMSVDELIARFLDQHQIHRTPAVWFDEELRHFTGIDVLRGDFDHDSGFQFATSRGFEAIVAQTDRLSGLSAEIGAFLGHPDLQIMKINDIGSTERSSAYDAFKQQFRPTDEMIDLLYHNVYTRHFFTESRIDQMIAAALGKDGSPTAVGMQAAR